MYVGLLTVVNIGNDGNVGVKCESNELSNFFIESLYSKSLDDIQVLAASGAPTHFTKYSS